MLLVPFEHDFQKIAAGKTNLFSSRKTQKIANPQN